MRFELLLTEDANNDLEDIYTYLLITMPQKKPKIFSTALKR
jgi:hypothetical protein